MRSRIESIQVWSAENWVTLGTMASFLRLEIVALKATRPVVLLEFCLILCCSTKMKSGFRNWSDVRIFLTVIREGSTLAASRMLNVAQPTVARRIDVLENELGLTLFERDTRGFKPTESARKIVPFAEAIEKAASEFSKKANELTEIRPIRVTAYSGNFSPRVTEIFSEYSALNPDIAFEFLPSVKVLDLEGGEADIALRITSKEPQQNLICRKISTARWSLYGSRGYAEKHGLPASCERLSDHQFVTFKRRDVPAALHEWLICHVAQDDIVMSFSEIDLMHAAIKSGHGLGLMNDKLAEMDDTLIRCFGPIEDLSRQHLMLIAPEAYRRPEVKAFVKFFAPRYAAVFK
ncbi:LysR family transcriptional regulator [Roseovarius litorisediminis]|nr:LysR family transcriptional regulator [Roseovarius litorisediminis]